MFFLCCFSFVRFSRRNRRRRWLWGKKKVVLLIFFDAFFSQFVFFLMEFAAHTHFVIYVKTNFFAVLLLLALAPFLLLEHTYLPIPTYKSTTTYREKQHIIIVVRSWMDVCVIVLCLAVPEETRSSSAHIYMPSCSSPKPHILKCDVILYVNFSIFHFPAYISWASSSWVVYGACTWTCVAAEKFAVFFVIYLKFKTDLIPLYYFFWERFQFLSADFEWVCAKVI